MFLAKQRTRRLSCRFFPAPRQLTLFIQSAAQRCSGARQAFVLKLFQELLTALDFPLIGSCFWGFHWSRVFAILVVASSAAVSANRSPATKLDLLAGFRAAVILDSAPTTAVYAVTCWAGTELPSRPASVFSNPATVAAS